MSSTESFSNYSDLEKKTTFELLQIINKEDNTVSLIIERSLKKISILIDKIFERMVEGGRLFYIGSGTPGRLGIVDASECPPTYGVDNNVIINRRFSLRYFDRVINFSIILNNVKYIVNHFFNIKNIIEVILKLHI